ncbi:MAG: hypothetical protein WDO70_08510 [Alphaproteobacteria bacterium]
MCLASVILLGLDLSSFIGDGVSEPGRLHFTQILELMRKWLPSYWTQTVNYINTQPQGEFWAWFAKFMVSLPATVVGLMIGFGLIVLGFRIHRYRDGP